MKNHPWYTVLVLFITGVVSFVLGGVLPAMDSNRNSHWNTSTHWEFIVAICLWLIIPAICLVSMLVVAGYHLAPWRRSGVL